MSNELVKTAQKQRIINSLKESEDFQKLAKSWWRRRWDDIKSIGNTAYGVGKFMLQDAIDNPWETAAGVGATLAGFGAPAMLHKIHKANKARKAWNAMNKLQKGQKYTKVQKQQKWQKINDAMNPTRGKYNYRDPVKFPGVKNPVNNPVAKAVASPYRTVRGGIGTFSHPTGFHIGRAPVGAGRIRKFFQPAATAAGLGVAAGEVGMAGTAIANNEWWRGSLYPVNAYRRYKSVRAMKYPEQANRGSYFAPATPGKPPTTSTSPKTLRTPRPPAAQPMGVPARPPQPAKPPQPPKLKPPTKVDWKAYNRRNPGP